jgi:hypothetical protein
LREIEQRIGRKSTLPLPFHQRADEATQVVVLLDFTTNVAK